MSNYIITQYSYDKAKQLNLIIKSSKNRNKKIVIYFFFYYLQNDLYYWKYDDTIDLRIDDNCFYRNVRKQYSYIPTKLLTKIN